MTIDLQRRIEELRAPNGRGCPGGPRCDDDIVALLGALDAAVALGDILKNAALAAERELAAYFREDENDSVINNALGIIHETVKAERDRRTVERDEAETKLAVAKKVIEAARWAMLAVLDPDSDPGTLAIVRPIAAEELMKAMAEWDAL